MEAPAHQDAPLEVPADAAVTKYFGDDVAVDGISLTVRTGGTILGIIGPSGSGKTTTIRMLTGALAPTGGRVRVLGEDPRAFLRQTRERIGYMPQQFTLYPDLTARENVDFVASLFGILWRTRHRRTREVLQLVDLWDVRGRRAGRLACALVHDPDLMFLDEPTAGIDPILRVRVWDELHRLRAEGRTLLVTTQYVNEAEACDTVALISRGRLIGLATPAELRREAMGGDVVEIQTTNAFDPAGLADLPMIRTIERQGPNALRIRVDDAARAMAEVVEAIAQRGGEVASASEARPSFDEVFAILVERDRVTRDAASGAAA